MNKDKQPDVDMFKKEMQQLFEFCYDSGLRCMPENRSWNERGYVVETALSSVGDLLRESPKYHKHSIFEMLEVPL